MKLLFVGTNPENTGAATHFVALARALKQAGHQLDAVAPRHGLIADGLASAGIPYACSTFRNVLDPRGYATTLGRIRRFPPDWIVGNFGKEYWPLIAISRATGIPLALFQHRNRRMKRLSEYGVPRLAQRFILVSSYARDTYIRSGVPAERLHISSNPIDTSIFRPDAAQGAAVRKALGIPDDAIVMGFLGRIHGGKGVHVLQQAARRAMADTARLHVLWIGGGPAEAQLRRHAETDPGSARQHFVGWRDDTAALLNACSFLAFPSVEPETFGRVSIEAQACGIPVLGSDIGGVPETLEHGVTGHLVEPDDVAAWHRQILAMCDPSRCAAMGTAARAFIERNFSNAIVARAFTQLLQGHQATQDGPVANERPRSVPGQLTANPPRVHDVRP